MKKLICLVSLCFSLFVFAGDNDAMMEMLKGMKLDKSQVSTMIDQLHKMGRITKKQAEDAKKELSGLSEKEFQQYNKVAVEKIKSGDANRMIQHDYTKGTPSLNPKSPVELPESSRGTASDPAPEAQKEAVIDFSKLGQ